MKHQQQNEQIIITLSLILGGNAYANSKEVIKTDGFLIPTNKWKDKIKINENFQVNNPEDKIIIIYNHGSDGNDVKLKEEVDLIEKMACQR